MLIVGNWKMNGDLKFAKNFTKAIVNGSSTHKCEYLICPPFTALTTVASMTTKSGIRLGAQDCHPNSSGAYTGNISVEMLIDVGCSYVIVGHSERRLYNYETDVMVKDKAVSAQSKGLTTIICVGETIEIREAGDALSFVGEQVMASVPPNATLDNTVIAYEPIWAIGTGKIPKVDEIAKMHAHIKFVLTKEFTNFELDENRVIYGGSVNKENSRIILQSDRVDGALVGGASLNAETFLAIGGSCP